MFSNTSTDPYTKCDIIFNVLLLVKFVVYFYNHLKWIIPYKLKNKDGNINKTLTQKEFERIFKIKLYF